MGVFNVFRLQDFTVEQINEIIDLAFEFKNGKKEDYDIKKKVAFLFYENSTKTQ